MKFILQSIPEVILIEPKVFVDGRGFFFESFNHKEFENAVGYSICFVQDNHSMSIKNVLRGLHYQSTPMAQGKLVRVVQGKVLDIAVDIRKDSDTYRQWTGEVLSAENKKQLWVPEGFAHGFITLSDKAEVLYKATNYYAPEHEHCLAWDDPSINVDWQLEKSFKPLLSDKDRQGIYLENSEMLK
jgi:dTDP-4-dehydrorhamnose 3,5-epimerase